MGETEAIGLQPNGLVHNAGPMVGNLVSERWMKAEERIAELISCIQPNQPSEARRNAVADYVQRLIARCFPCQVFTFGSVPLKTYLPDGDIDLSAFSNNPNLKETWAYQVRDMLESEEHNANAEFRVNEVQYIQADVKIIKCLVDNIVVDISFNQLGGLCTLCFLEEVDHLISQNHLFKRSIILIKAWCYYESRLLGAHHGLISTYALETLVLYIFHVFNNSFTGPLEVLYRFLEFFSNFDWDNFCVSLWGPVPISSLPDVTAQPPRKDGGDFLLSKLFLDACSSVYSVIPGGQENQGPPFLSKYFNVIDPLRFNNNLGRSVSKGNFFRIRSAFAFGAKRLARLLNCPEENLLNEVNQFFFNTWERHGTGDRPDALHAGDFSPSRLPSPDQLLVSDDLKENCDSKTSNSNSSGNCSAESTSRTTEATRAQTKNGNGTLQSSKASEKVPGKVNPNSSAAHFDKGQRSLRPDNLLNEIQGKFLFARTHSSPELTDTYRDVSPRKSVKGPESAKATGEEMNRTNHESELPINHSIPSSSGGGTLPARHAPHQAFEAYTNSSGHTRDRGLGAMTNEAASVGRMQGMHQEEHNLVNMMASSTLSSVNGQQVHMPLNLASGHPPMPVPPSILASMGFAHRNFGGMFPPNMPFIDPSFANMQFPQGLIPPPLPHYFPGMRVPTHSGTEDFGSREMNAGETDRDFCQEQQSAVSSGGLGLDDRNYVMQQSYDNGNSRSVSSGRVHQNFSKENRVDCVVSQDGKCDICSDDRTTSSRFSSAAHSSSLRSKTSSESSWDGSSVNAPNSTKSTREKQGNGTVPTEERNSLSAVGRGAEERNSSLQLGGPLQAVPHLHAYELAQSSGSESMIPFAPIMLNPDSRQRVMDPNPGGVPFDFYPTGPPVPFLTMLPFYNNDNTTAGEEGLDGCDSGREKNSLNPPRSAFLPYNEVKPDILNSDFASHWKNLQFGRFCQNPRPLGGPLVFPSPPPGYLPGRFPWDGPGRPQSANMNMFSHLMGYGPRMIPVAAPLQPVPNRAPNVYQRFADEMPRQRSGTGTYLPHHKVPVRDRHSSNPRKANYNYDRSDSHGDREGNWNSSNTKSRSSSRSSHNRNQSEKSTPRVDRLATSESRAERSWNSHRHDPVPPSQSQNGPPNSSQSGPSNAGHGMHSLPSVSPINGSSANGRAVPPVVMVYPYNHNPNSGTHTEQLQFGSLPVSPSVINDQTQASEGNRPRGALVGDPRFRGASQQRSSNDQSSSPRIQRLAQRNYQLKEEDFPPLASPNQAENDVWEKL